MLDEHKQSEEEVDKVIEDEFGSVEDNTSIEEW